MAVRGIQVYPTCDIHLLLHGPGNTPTTYQLLVRDEDVREDGTQPDFTTSAQTTVTFFRAADGTNVIDVSPAGLITPLAIGETFIRIRYVDPDPTPDPDDPPPRISELVVRVRVHEDMDDLWIGNNQVSLRRGLDDYVLTVYGHFTDGTVGDVSCHPYLTFTSADPTRVRVNDTDDKGRLSGVAETPANTSVPVSVGYKTLSGQVPVRVGPPMNQPRRVAECIHGDPRAADRWDILLIAEGFPADQASLFRHITRLLIDRLFQSELHAPFPLLKDLFNVWVVFEPSAEAGVTPGSFLSKAGGDVDGRPFLQGWPVPLELKRLTEADTAGNYSLLELVSRVGLPDRYRPLPATRAEARTAWAATVANTDFVAGKVEDKILDFWLGMREYHLAQARDTRCGLLQGARPGDRSSRRVNPAAPPEPVMRWYLPPVPARGLDRDRRRLPRNWDRAGGHHRYIASLQVDPAKHPGADTPVFFFARAVYLANEDYGGGTNTGVIMLSVRNTLRYLGLHPAGPRADHEPIALEPTPSLTDMAGTNMDQMAAVLAHELGHGLRLGDEYDGFDYVGEHNLLPAADTPRRRWIQRWHNLTHHHVVGRPAVGPDAIDIGRVKWQRWHRIRACSVLTAAAQSLPNNGLRVRVRPPDLAKWRDAKDRGASVFVRTRNINDDDPDADVDTVALRAGPLTIDAVHDDGTIDLLGTSLAIVGDRDVLYEPVVENGAPLTVFHPAVLQFLGTAPAKPFALKADVTRGSREPGTPPEALFQAHPTFTPADLAAVVGVYDGGGTYNSKVYRSSGICKMRTTKNIKTLVRPDVFDPAAGPFDPPVLGKPEERLHFLPFCYVCQYVLVNQIDPTRLDRLVYPR